MTIQTASGSRLVPRSGVTRISYGPWSAEQEEKEKREEERRKKEEAEKQKKAREERERQRKAYEEELSRARRERERLARERADQQAEVKRRALLEKESIARQEEELARARKKQEEEARLVQEKVQEVRETAPPVEEIAEVSKQEAELKKQTEEILKPDEEVKPQKEQQIKPEVKPEVREITREEKSGSSSPGRWRNFSPLPFLAPGLAQWERGQKGRSLALSGSTALLLTYTLWNYRTYQTYQAAYERPVLPLLLLRSDQGFALNYLYFGRQRATLAAQANRLNLGLAVLGGLYAFNTYDVLAHKSAGVSLLVPAGGDRAEFSYRFSF